MLYQLWSTQSTRQRRQGNIKWTGWQIPLPFPVYELSDYEHRQTHQPHTQITTPTGKMYMDTLKQKSTCHRKVTHLHKQSHLLPSNDVNKPTQHLLTVSRTRPSSIKISPSLFVAPGWCGAFQDGNQTPQWTRNPNTQDMSEYTIPYCGNANLYKGIRGNSQIYTRSPCLSWFCLSRDRCKRLGRLYGSLATSEDACHLQQIVLLQSQNLCRHILLFL